jgi:hypothetical protein
MNGLDRFAVPGDYLSIRAPVARHTFGYAPIHTLASKKISANISNLTHWLMVQHQCDSSPKFGFVEADRLM